MKKFFVISICLILAMLTACRNETNEPEDEQAFVFVPEFTSLSALAGDLPNISNIIITENTIYLTSASDIKNDSLFRTTRIFSIDLDKSALSYLPDYIAASPPRGAEGGGVYINSMQLDSDGNLWVAETGKFVTFDFPPDFNIEEADVSEIWVHSKPMETSNTVRKLDTTGAELLSLDITIPALSIQSGFDITAFCIDDESNIFIGSGPAVHVFDTDGNLLFSLETGDFIHPRNLIRLSDGTVAYGVISGYTSLKLQTIDVQNKAHGAIIDLSGNAYDIFNGSGEYLVIFNDNINLYGIDIKSGDTVQILNWAKSGVDAGRLDSILILPDKRVMLTIVEIEYSSIGQSSHRIELITLNITPQEEVKGKTVLSLFSFMPYSVNAAVAEFNRTNASYRIEVTDFFEGANMIDMNLAKDGIDKLALDIITGSGPDIIHTTMIPFHQWAARGLFLDLYEFIDADAKLDRSDFIESVLRSTEMNGKLYQFFPHFQIITLIGHPDVVGSTPGWNLDEFMEVINNNPQADRPFGRVHDGNAFIGSLFSNNVDIFIDWDAGTVNFENEYFIGLLEFAYMLNSRIGKIDIDLTYDDFGNIVNQYRPYEWISNGEQILESVYFSVFEYYSVFQDLFGGDFVFKGYPVENGSGSSLYGGAGFAITSTSKNKEGVWEFIRMLMSEEWQTENVKADIPTNKNVFEKRLSEAMLSPAFPSMFWMDLDADIRPLTQEQANKIRALIDSASGITFDTFDPLMDIIWDSLFDLNNGKSTARDAAQIIQNRAAIYVAEQR